MPDPAASTYVCWFLVFSTIKQFNTSRFVPNTLILRSMRGLMSSEPQSPGPSANWRARVSCGMFLWAQFCPQKHNIKFVVGFFVLVLMIDWAMIRTHSFHYISITASPPPPPRNFRGSRFQCGALARTWTIIRISWPISQSLKTIMTDAQLFWDGSVYWRRRKSVREDREEIDR